MLREVFRSAVLYSCCLIGAGSSAAALPIAAFAREDGDSKPRAGATVSMDEVVVTARKRAEALRNVPVAISAVAGERVEELNTRDLLDLQGYAPNLIIDPINSGPGVGSFYIRGIGTQELERSFDPAVGVFLDGIYLATTTGSLLNTFDIEQIEVLRGPQGTLFGKNTIGGAATLKRTRPTGDPEFRGKVTVGSDGRNDYAGVLNFPVIERTLAGKLSVFRNNDEGFAKNAISGSRTAGDRYQSLGGELLFTPGENFEVHLRYERAEDRRDTGPLVNISGPGEFVCSGLGFCGEPSNLERTSSNFSNATDFDLDAITVEANLDLGPVVLTSLSGWRSTDERVFQDFDSVPVDFFSTIRDQTNRQLSQELRFKTLASEWVDLLGGLYYIKNDYRIRQRTLFLPQALLVPAGAVPPGTTETLQRAGQDSFSYAAFAEADIALTKALTLTLGGRYTYEDKDFDSVQGLQIGPTALFNPVAADDEDFDELTGRVGLSYRASDTLFGFLSYSKGFRSGGFNGRNANPQDIGPYRPEKVKSLEAGVKSSWFDQRLSLNASIFRSRYDDKQEEFILADPTLGSVTVVGNASKADFWGWELETEARPTSNWVIRGLLGYLDADYDRFTADIDGPDNDPMRCPAPGPGCVVIPTDNSKLDLRRAPEWQWTLSSTYTLPLGPGELSFEGAYRYVDSYQTDAQNDPRGNLDDIGITDASVSYSFATRRAEYVVRLFGRNLQDIVVRNSAVIIPGTLAFAGVDPGVTYGLSVELLLR